MEGRRPSERGNPNRLDSQPVQHGGRTSTTPSSTCRLWRSAAFAEGKMTKLRLTSCDFVGDKGCSDLTCPQCHPSEKVLRKRLLSERSVDVSRGVKAAADLLEQYDSSSTHTHKLGDCVLHKFNLRKAKPRKNQKRVPNTDHAWTCGFATALAEVYRLLLNGHEPKGICAIAAAAGVDLATLRRAGVSEFDVRALRRAGLS